MVITEIIIQSRRVCVNRVHRLIYKIIQYYNSYACALLTCNGWLWERGSAFYEKFTTRFLCLVKDIHNEQLAVSNFRYSIKLEREHFTCSLELTSYPYQICISIQKSLKLIAIRYVNGTKNNRLKSMFRI